MKRNKLEAEEKFMEKKINFNYLGNLICGEEKL
jgi:hypothetical protein